MNEIIIICAKYLIYISAIYACGYVILRHERKHHIWHIVIIFGSAVVAWLIAHVLKGQIGHPRPDAALALITPEDQYSFPSGHATFMFALAFASWTFSRFSGRVLFILALVTGIARVLAHVHYWYDILGGMVLGAGVASLIAMAAKRFLR
jgi:undecaprenyl-diphosphatase